VNFPLEICPEDPNSGRYRPSSSVAGVVTGRRWRNVLDLFVKILIRFTFGSVNISLEISIRWLFDRGYIKFQDRGCGL